MRGEDHREFEARVQTLCEQGRHDEATTCAIERYGPALLRFLVSMSQGDTQIGEDVFQSVCVKVWERMPAFTWEGSLRAWVFVVARHAFLNHRRDQQRKREEALGERLPAVAARLSRTVTQEWRKTEVKDKLWASIEGLPPDDRALLMLRLHQQMRWTEIARILHDGDEEPDAAELRRGAAAARKRYERLKGKLRDLMDAS